MSKPLHRLKVATVIAAKAKTGHINTQFADGGGLYLQVTNVGTKSWLFKYTIHGRTRGMGLGAVTVFSLAEVRDIASDLRKKVAQGIDVIEERDRQKAKAVAARAARMTFADAMKQCLVKKFSELENPKHRKQWQSTLETYVLPRLGNKWVDEIDVQDVFAVLNPIWVDKTETATRVRSRIESVLSWATVSKYRSGENPAKWRGNLAELLPKPSAVATKRHQPSISVKEIPQWWISLKDAEGLAARALQFLTLCASRSGEVRGATWEEFDLDAGVWTIPARRMKASREHRVPLSAAALEILDATPRFVGNDLVFPGAKGGPMSDMTLSAVMRRMHATKVKQDGQGWVDQISGDPAVPHGLRSTFRVWAAESGVVHDLAEICLAHDVATEVERAYRRTDMVDQRRSVMDNWANFCIGK